MYVCMKVAPNRESHNQQGTSEKKTKISKRLNEFFPFSSPQEKKRRNLYVNVFRQKNLLKGVCFVCF